MDECGETDGVNGWAKFSGLNERASKRTNLHSHRRQITNEIAIRRVELRHVRARGLPTEAADSRMYVTCAVREEGAI
jgi:hypothetical protein